MKKFLLAIALMLSLGTVASSQVADISLYIATISPGGGAIVADARYVIFRGDPLGQAATGNLYWQLEHCDSQTDWHLKTLTQSSVHNRVVFPLDEAGLFRLTVLDDLGLSAVAYFRMGPLP